MANLVFREINRDIFEAILNGSKKVETRAASPQYQNFKKGEKITLVCGDQKEKKTIKSVHYFKSIDEMLTKYKVSDINPYCKTENELKEVYLSFPNCEENLKEYGLVALEFV